MDLKIQTPSWAIPLLEPKRYKAIKGGRGSGKSHERAEALVETLLMDPDAKFVCIREIQKSLTESVKVLIEQKIKKFRVEHMFNIKDQYIAPIKGDGLVIFRGMQNHTADSIKSLEGFKYAWVEEAQTLSRRSLELLTPTIRMEGSELWFTWNPRKSTDPVDEFFNEQNRPANSTVVHVNYDQNPFISKTLLEDMVDCRRRDYDLYRHVWLGEYEEKSEERIFNKRWRVDSFEVDHTFGQPNQGLDFGFSQDPTAAIRLYIKDKKLFISHEAGAVGLELDQTVDYLTSRIPGFEKYPTYADKARPESISYLKRHGLPKISAADKWPGSIEDGITHIKSYDEIIIHPRCKHTQHEFNEYRYKVDRNTGEITDVIIDANNHYIDGLRYALYKIIRRGKHDYSKLLKHIA